MQKDIDLRLSPKQAASHDGIVSVIALQFAIPKSEITAIRILRRSIDARQRNILVNLRVRAYIGENEPELQFESIIYGNVLGKPQAIVVGCGPAGLFAALRLIELGIRPIVVERGKNVRDRKRDTALMSTEHTVNPESNYCFGEGGAGAYSDGKLYTRSKKRGNIDKILRVFCQYGAPTDILVDAHPHIGTDKLPAIIEKMRIQIEQSGGEVHFETRMDKLIVENGEVKGIETSTGKTFRGKVILATGHSARDVYYMLHSQKVKIEAKALAVGVRVEHAAHLIDQIQYHSKDGRGNYLPAAEYSFVVQSGGRGVYSFCMCPGGTIVPSASGERQVVVNGMSPSNRGSHWSNSGVVVEIHPEDLPDYANYGELSMLKFQEDIEELTWERGGKSQVVPAQRMDDFVNNKQSESLPKTSYAAGVVSSPLHEWLPTFIRVRLQDGFKQAGAKHKGYLTNEALLLAVESRTSSPVRVVRNNETMEHVEVKGLYPCGEGAGYAGGIVSAAMDGERCAEALAAGIINMTVIQMPSTTGESFGKSFLKLFKILENFRNCPLEKEIIFDFKGCRFLTPFFVLPLMLFVKQERAEGRIIKYINIENSAISNYLKTIFFINEGLNRNLFDYNYLQLNYSTRTYIPLISFPVRYEHIRNEVVGFVQNLLIQRLNITGQLHSTISYLISESVDNVAGHSREDRGYIFYQYYPTLGYVDICIADIGIGVLGSYQENNDRDVITHLQAIQSASLGRSTKNLPDAENRGYGIITSKRILKAIGGIYFLYSGNAFYLSSNDKNAEIPNSMGWNGTIVALRVPKAIPANFNYINYLE